jgi:hypothetical protein
VAFAQVFDESGPRDRAADVARLRLLLTDSGTAPERRHADEATGQAGIPVHPALAPLLPKAGLARGTIVAMPHRVAPDPAGDGCPSYLALAMIAGATAGGAWAAVVNVPSLGIAALNGLGADLRRVLLVEAGDRWLDALDVLAPAVDVVLLASPGRTTAEQQRRVAARVRPTARQRGSVLLVAGAWGGAQLTLRTDRPRWSGLGDGFGNLTGRRVTVTADGRGANGRSREVDLMLPAGDGTVRAAAEESGEVGMPGLGGPDFDERPRLRIA